jgi:endonuclease/exonuclease/phosphatase family metal-dependent hydrolase
MRFRILLSLLLLRSALLAAQPDTLTYLQYNLLKFEIPTARMAYLETILHTIKPDIFLANELKNNTSAYAIVNDALNTRGVTKYQRAIFTTGPDTGNLLYFNADKLGLYNQGVLQTSPRWTNRYVLYYKDPQPAGHDTVFITIYTGHFKASQGFETERLTQATTIRNHIDARPVIENTFVSGDFNLYTSAEPSYQKLLSAGPGQLHDPINTPGSWSNNAAFAAVHTQSPRTQSFGGGVTGGMDDRFDFILTTNDVLAGTNGITYLPGSYQAYGNDGLHFNQSIINPPSHPTIHDSIRLALHNFTDHLPVVMKMTVTPQNMTATPADISFNEFSVTMATVNPQSIHVSTSLQNKTHFRVFNSLGQPVMKKEMSGNAVQDVQLPALSPGVYFVSATNGSHLITRKLVIR